MIKKLCLSTLAAACLISIHHSSGYAGSNNEIPIRMGFPPHSGFNRLLVSVTVCKPGSSQCVTVNDVMIDTGSTGLRLQSFALPADFRLPSVPGPDRKPLAECLHFESSRAWGSVVRADIRFGSNGPSALGVPIQVIGDSVGPRPDSCAGGGATPTSNGTLGIGIHATDCSGVCTQSIQAPRYYTCDQIICSPLAGQVDQSYRLPNPVTRLNGHNNGIIIDFPKVSPNGSIEAKGTLSFGLDNSGPNNLGSARRLFLGATGRFTTLYNGQAYPASYIDSGTETYVLPNDQLNRCKFKTAGFCPAADTKINLEFLGQDQARVAETIVVGNYEALRNSTIGASDRLAIYNIRDPNSYVYGAPFFLGRKIYLLFEGQSVQANGTLTGPMYGIMDH